MIYLKHKKVKLKKVHDKKEVFLSLWNFWPLADQRMFYVYKTKNMKNNNFSANLKLPTGIPSDLFQLEIVLFHFYVHTSSKKAIWQVLLAPYQNICKFGNIQNTK